MPNTANLTPCRSEVSVIAAVAQNMAIGFENKLIYWLPNDLRRFKLLTTGHTIIMGRRTYESLPKGALPNRRNIVLSRSASPACFPGCELFRSLADALAATAEGEKVFIIGGHSVYREALPLAHRLCLTLVADTPAQADTFFPPIGPEWRETSRESHPADDRHAYPYAFVDYVRE